jgi:hypothetical protein
MRFVKATSTADDLYLIPTDLRRFRLETGARVYVDWKSHPYRDVEVLEWYARIEKAKAFERASGDDACRIAEELLREAGVTGFVVEAKKNFRCATLDQAYGDGALVVFHRRLAQRASNEDMCKRQSASGVAVQNDTCRRHRVVEANPTLHGAANLDPIQSPGLDAGTRHPGAAQCSP